MASRCSDSGLDRGPEVGFGEQAGLGILDELTAVAATVLGFLLDLFFDAFSAGLFGCLGSGEFVAERTDCVLGGDPRLDLRCHRLLETSGLLLLDMELLFGLSERAAVEHSNDAGPECSDARKDGEARTLKCGENPEREPGDAHSDRHESA